MSTTETEPGAPAPDPEPEPDDEERAAARHELVRSFPVEIAPGGDGRTIDLRVVPYNTPAVVSDPPYTHQYRETWVPGVFSHQTNAAHRVQVLLNFEHIQGLPGVIGHGVSLADKPDGLHGTFRILENSDGDKALELVRAGILTGASLEASAKKSRVVNGTVERVKAHLDKVALCRTPAFAAAQILAVRTAPALVEAPAGDPVVDGLLAARGVQPLGRVTLSRSMWDGSRDRFTDEQWQRACLVDLGGDDPIKMRCLLPVLDPDGAVNPAAFQAAAQAIHGSRLAGVSRGVKADAARKLLRYYRAADMSPPDVIRRIAAT